MDDNAGRRRHEQPGSSSSNHRYSIHDPNAPRRQYGSAGSDRYRPSSSLNAPPNPRGMGGTTSYNGYYQESATGYSQPMTQNTMAYPHEYGQESRQTHGYNAYNTSMLYNVPQPGAQASVYDTSQQYPSRQAAGMHMMPADVSTPYFSNESTHAVAAASLQPQTAPSSTSAVYQQGTADQRLLQSTTDQHLLQQGPSNQRMLQPNYPNHITTLGAMAQTEAPEQALEEPETPAAAAASAAAAATSGYASNVGEMNEAYARYQNALRDIFAHIRSGALITASHTLLEVSRWLLSNVQDLGLIEDNEGLQQDRLRLWRDFNHAWLSLGQKQKDMHESDVPLHRTQSLISKDDLQNMGDELVRLCDRIERYGLVDYEYGVWEENILDILGQCCDLYETNRRSPQEPSSSNNPTNIGESSHSTRVT